MTEKQAIINYIREDLRKRVFRNLSGPKDGSSQYEQLQLKRINSFNENTQIIEDGYLDSWSLVMLKHFVEETCHIRIDDTQATVKTFSTVNYILELVQSIRQRQ